MKMVKWIVKLAVVLVLLGGCAIAEEITRISDRAGLEAMAANPSGQYELVNDIDLAGEPWKPIAFSGTLDGCGHTVYNITLAGLDEETPRDSVDGNHKEYETYYAGFFSVLENAEISNLILLNEFANITTKGNAFLGGLTGYSMNSTMENVSVQGILSLTSMGRNFGAGGMVGFGRIVAKSCTTDVTVITTDPVADDSCEEFLGGLLACGYGTISKCTVRLQGYASVHGYVHSGGVVGMAHTHVKKEAEKDFWMKNCLVKDTAIHFFEDVGSRRAYCGKYIGENLHNRLRLDSNRQEGFTADEHKDYSAILLPEMCDNPVYTSVVTPPTGTEFGYTTCTCVDCGWSYRDHYVAPERQ